MTQYFYFWPFKKRQPPSPQMEAARQLYEAEIEMLGVELEKEAVDAKRGKLSGRIMRLQGYLKRAADAAEAASALEGAK